MNNDMQISELTAAIGQKAAELAQLRGELEQLKDAPLESLLQVIASVCGVTPADVKGNSRVLGCIIPRQVFCYVANQHHGAHVTRIAAIINKSRPTVIHSVRSIAGLLEVRDAETTRIINQIIN